MTHLAGSLVLDLRFSQPHLSELLWRLLPATERSRKSLTIR
jgi:hypothetical protein